MSIEEANKVLEKAIMGVSDEQITFNSREMKRKYNISKIKITKEFPHYLTVEYHGANTKGSKETKFTGYEEMLDEDYLLIQSMIPQICEIMEFPTDWVEDFTVTGLSLNYDTDNDDALRGMVVTMQKKINSLNCPLNINTPFIKFSNYVDNYSTFPSAEATWSNAVNAKVLKIIENTFKYMCGNSKTVQRKFDMV